MSSYQSFAFFYDMLTTNISYEKRGEYFNTIINNQGKSDGILVDLGCGTGSLCEVMSKKGYDVIGIDNSYDMLNQAINKRYDSGLDIMYLCQDMTEIDLYGTMDICISALDTLNHIINIKELEKVFAKISLFLHPDGIFIFDVNTIYKHQQILANNTYVYDYDEIYCVWQNTLLENNIININLDLFCKNEDLKYTKETESFCECAYTHEEIVELIKSTNLELVDYYADDSFDKPVETTQRVIYVVKSTKNKGC